MKSSAENQIYYSQVDNIAVCFGFHFVTPPSLHTKLEVLSKLILIGDYIVRLK